VYSIWRRSRLTFAQVAHIKRELTFFDLPLAL
jgi:hypothetical protein